MSRLTRSMMIFCLLPFAFAACAIDGEDDFDDEEGALDADDEIGVDAEPEALVAVPFCQDLVLQQVQPKFCGFQDGPLDDSPVFVQCARTCVTDRYVTFSPGSGGATCNTGETDCSAWVCPSCDFN
jgi:hypothetical protein